MIDDQCKHGATWPCDLCDAEDSEHDAAMAAQALTEQKAAPLPPHQHSLNSGRFDPLYTADQMRAYATAAVAAERAWRDAVDDMLTVAHMVASDDPRESINRLINWHVAVALDPAVSSDAAALVAAEREWLAELMERQHAWISNAAASRLIRQAPAQEGEKP